MEALPSIEVMPDESGNYIYVAPLERKWVH